MGASAWNTSAWNTSAWNTSAGDGGICVTSPLQVLCPELEKTARTPPGSTPPRGPPSTATGVKGKTYLSVVEQRRQWLDVLLRRGQNWYPGAPRSRCWDPSRRRWPCERGVRRRSAARPAEMERL
eukprot:scaffold4349_cov258-Pinguiococcus_pyrenoidosus.AAC.5